ncbi:MAG TPA: hypothetical protein H9740_11090 [Candidatus Hungatella pullicola]|nr:hypothetical protein [Candidatus Hungatella pullicola]
MKLWKKAGILLVVFVAATAGYFIWNQKTPETIDTTVYTSMDEPFLPVVYTTVCGREMNLLHGYTQDMGQAASRETLTVLPQDRALNIRIVNNASPVQEITYEVRTLDLDRLVERTTVTERTEEEGSVQAILPIQNLLTADQEYLLILTVNMEDGESVQYYTRILWTENDYGADMIDFALNFTTKTFDYDQARELTTYLETDPAQENVSLGQVNIHSSFSQLTWGGLPANLEGEIQVRLKDLDGIMGSIQLEYLVSITDDNGLQELYEAEDNFTLRWDSKRIYLMEFERNMSQIFSGRKEAFSGQKIMLGITREDEVEALESTEGKCVAFVTNRELWIYNQTDSQAVKVFSFRSGKDDGLRSSYNQHDIKILSVSDQGDVSFLVYGYMNRGIREGNVGIAMYQYSSEDNGIQEKLFIPVQMSFERMKTDLDRLCHLGDNGMLYMMLDQSVFGIDLSSNEYMVLADSLSDGTFAVSGTGRHLAWQEDSHEEGSSVLHLMDLDTGRKREIGGQEGSLYRPLGFVGDDFIYGISYDGEEWIENGRVEDYPMYRIEIMDENGTLVKEYEIADTYITGVQVEGSRIHLTQIRKTADHTFETIRQDTIVCNEDLGDGQKQGISSSYSGEKQTVYYVQVNQSIRNEEVKVSVPKKVAYETAQVMELKGRAGQEDEILFHAYGAGHYLGSSREFTDALTLAYDRMGVVVTDDWGIIWDRVNRPSVKNISSPETMAAELLRQMEGEQGTGRDSLLVLDGGGCTLSQVLYFIGRGCPVIAYTGDGGYVILSGYDQYNVTIFNPVTQESEKMGLNDGNAYFTSLGNDFVCGVIKE